VFQLFNHPVNFTGGVTLQNMSGGGILVSNKLAIDGSIAVIATVNTQPTNITVSVSGGNINLSWPSDHTGWTLQAQTNSLTRGLSTNDADWFDVPGSASMNSTNIHINVNTNGAVFYRLKL
jgi:hypothetical protein